MKIGVIGANGFIGREIYDHLPESDRHMIFRESWKDIHYDVIIDANGSSMKYLDFDASVNSVMHYVNHLKYDKYIYLSSIDAATARLSNYGFNRSIAEQVVTKYADNWTIIRLCSVIGPEAQKGIVYDILNDNKLFVTKASFIQIIPAHTVAVKIKEAFHGEDYKTLAFYSNGGIGVNKICHMFGKDPDVDDAAETQYYNEAAGVGFLTPEEYLKEAFYERVV